jgi:hypothetical protein
LANDLACGAFTYPYKVEDKAAGNRIPLLVDEGEVDLVPQGGRLSGITVGDGGRVDEGEFLGPVEWVWGYRGDFAKDKFPNLLRDVRDIYGHDLSLIDQSRMFRPVKVVSKVIPTSVTADFERDVMRL